MFEGMDMNALLAQAQQMQEQMLAARDSLAEQEFQAASGGGVVSVKVNGLGDLVDVTIAPEAWDPEDTDSLGALIVAAYRTAREAAEQAASAAAPQIPGMGF
ncbi:YbaB/EbfC family nucleoid-associated protein [Arachnia propionica]|uniref:Nucleoid-associated protein EII34_14820 n=1 Tax=Arachnia propionica TaxID=1750 RepID=A0A3P1T1I6_9ACTN|nr:YbaB/EbfC family nucleoid-associated protein [Arachnia propionica]MDO5082975.1 YbaB/EbfC family nucleoid-associated protein [Arachnia propionica]RRD03270.1 YbaB/EbfC family nucleoid-associated protein [Arachnia propionica]